MGLVQTVIPALEARIETAWLSLSMNPQDSDEIQDTVNCLSIIVDILREATQSRIGLDDFELLKSLCHKAHEPSLEQVLESFISCLPKAMKAPKPKRYSVHQKVLLHNFEASREGAEPMAASGSDLTAGQEKELGAKKPYVHK